MKRLAEDCVEQVSGVKEVQNHLRIHSSDCRPTNRTGNERPGNERSGTTASGTTASPGTGNEKDKKAQA